MNVLLALISLFVFIDHLRKAISGSTKPMFAKFSIYGRYFIVDYSADFFPVAQGRLPWQPILGSKW